MGRASAIRMLLVALLWLAVASVLALSSHAQTEPAPAPAAPAAEAPPAPAVPSPLPLPTMPGVPTPATGAAPAADVDSLIATLENPAARDQLLAQLRALAAAKPTQEEAGADAVTEAIKHLSDEMTDRANIALTAIIGLAESIAQLPVLIDWLGQQLTEPASRALWQAIGRQVGIALLAGFAASLLLRAALRPWCARVRNLPEAAPTWPRLKASLVHLVVNLAALAVFLAVTYAVIAYGEVSVLARRVAGDVLTGIAWGRLLTAIVRAVVASDDPRRRLVDLDDASAQSLQGWANLFIGFAIYGYFALEAARRLGLPWTVHGFVRHLLFFVVTVLAVSMIYRVRAQVGAAIDSWGSSSTSIVARYLPWGLISTVGHHVLALWVVLLFLTWAVGEPDGTFLLSRGVLGSILVLLLLRALNVWLARRMAPLTVPTVTEDQEAEPKPASPSNVALVTAIRILSGAAALAVVLQLWGIDVVEWVRSDAGEEVLAAMGRIAVILALCLILIRGIDFGARRYIEARDENGVFVHGNRPRTLASLIRNLTLTLIVIVGVVNVLAEVGVNATALLAGAGVVGLAIGFGSQKLVQDLITGLFILLGDTVRVGDVVDLGGKSGVVESISMRTIVLRDYGGNVHTVPYSSIDVVTNMTKDFSFWVFDIQVAYKEDVDQVMHVLRDIDSQLRREWPYRRLILEPLEIAGVDAFRESAVIVKARTKTRAGEQWKVGREFNRRIKHRFEELGIEIPFPQRTISFATDKEGQAPPAFIEELRAELTKPAAPRAMEARREA